MSTRLTRRTAASLTAFRVPDEGLGRGKIERRRHRRSEPFQRTGNVRQERGIVVFGKPAPRAAPAVFAGFFFEGGGDLAIFAPGCGHPLSGARGMLASLL